MGEVERLDPRGRVTIKAPFRGMLAEGYIQVLTPDGIVLAPVPKRIQTKAPSLVDVDDEAAKDL